MHCSHFKSRRYVKTRHSLLNVAPLCASCHKEMGDHPDKHTEWFTNWIGQEKYDRLIALHNSIAKPHKGWDMEKRKHWGEQEKRIDNLRLQGVTGYIEPEPMEFEL